MSAHSVPEVNDLAPLPIPLRKNIPPPAEVFLGFLLNRVTCLVALAGLVVGMFILPPAGMTPSTCGMERMVALPCPSCGLTRSVTCVYQGNLLAAWQYNPFGYGFAVIFALLGPLVFLRKYQREWLKEKLRPFSKLILIAIISFASLMLLHGFIRMGLIAGGVSGYEWWRKEKVPPAMQSQVKPGTWAYTHMQSIWQEEQESSDSN